MSSDQLAFEFAGRSPQPDPRALLPRAEALRLRLGQLAQRGVYIGTSSWKYPGWLAQVYNPARYEVRGRISQRGFAQGCLEEYARIFPTVCGDFAFYQFPTPAAWRRMFDQIPAGFRFGLKVPEDVTVERFPDLPRYGERSGTRNPSFLDAGLVSDQLLAPLSDHRDRLGPIVFQFGQFHAPPLTEPAAFAERLDAFLGRLPTRGFEFAVEVRNAAFLSGPDVYLSVLRRHGVAHALNSWTRMPSITDQMATPGVLTAPHAVARFLLRPHRKYEEAVRLFSPYESAKDPYPEGRTAMRALIESFQAGPQKIYVFVNNRLEGNAIETIESVTGDAA